ncbi:hypothetical protein [Blastopirellula marina]|uniref:DUF4175 domain-containing protein n=1 Tax=Blastopirellula marina TaxID=124 RepID=A0A2S8F6J5_9BACT|nr:hypothetical protein [Blastopirellula marina]PQO27760.1 hypothetical protein C5Y98_27085 [Blastopirellula marina]PTL41500.1 hypothetical protein C5Y97_27100 [Blastopirellula marina]
MASDAGKSNAHKVHHMLVDRVEEARQAVMRRVRVRGTAWGLFAAISFILAMALFDYLLRQDDIGTRWFLSLLTLAGLVFAFVWWTLPAWHWHPSLQQIAQRIEQFFPELRDKISSALFFLQQDEADAAGSSPYFRRKQISEMTATLGHTDLSVALNRQLATRSLYALAGVSFVLLSVVAFSPQSFGTAVTRLAMPWRAVEWPRTNDLALVDPPQVVPLGGRANFAVEDLNRNLPELVELQIRYEPGGRPMTYPMQFDFPTERMVYQLEGIQRPFEFRVQGGDDDTMAWQAVDVVKPPKFSDVQVTLIPPEYTRWLPSESPRSIIALEGTSLQLFGKVDQKITEASFVFEAAGKSESFPLEIGADRLSFSTKAQPDAANQPTSPVGPVLAASGNYWIEVTVESGLKKAEGQRFPVRVIKDKAPIVSWVAPERNLTLTPKALLDLSATVRDDLQTESIKLGLRKPADNGPLLEETLYTGPADRPFESAPTNLAMGQAEQRSVDYPLDLSKLNNLVPGMALELVVTANDYRPQAGKSLPRIITIISDEQLDQRVNRQQRDIISKIAEARRLQQDARQQTRSVEIELEEGSPLGPAEMANLQNGEQNQKSVRDKLVAGEESAAAKIDALLDELKQNRQEDHDAAGMLRELKEKIAAVASADLSPIESELTDLRRSASRQQSQPGSEQEKNDPQDGNPDAVDQPADSPEAKQQQQEQLKQIGQRQEKVAGQLQDWQNDLNKWDTFRRFAQDVRDLANRQAELSRNVQSKQGETLGQEVEQMTPEQRAALKQMGEQQGNLASEMDRIQSRMRDMLQNNPESEEVANTLQDAINENRDAAVSQRMRQAGQRIEQNQLSSAKDSQKEVENALEDVLDTLQNRRETNKKELLRKLDEAQQDLQKLKERQKELKDKAKDAQMQNPSDPAGQNGSPQSQQQKREQLAAQAKQLQQQVEQLARKLERLSAKEAAQKLRDAAQRLEDAAQQAQNMDQGQLEQQIEQAQQDLEEAEKELEKQKEQLEQDLAEEVAAKLKQSIELLIIRQERIRDELVRLKALQVANGELTSAQKQTLSGLSIEQATLTDEIRTFAEAIAKAEVYHLSLQMTAEVTSDLARLLDTGNLDQSMIDLADEAVDRLKQLVAALEEEQKQQQAQQNQPQQGQDQQQQQPSGGSQDGISQTAQLRLLKMMQESLKARTQKLGEQIAAEPKSAKQNDLARLAAEQGRLSELTLNLIKTTAEELFDPDKLPEIEPTAPGEDQQEVPDVE